MVERMLADNAPAAAIVTAVRAMECVTMRHATITSPSRDASRDALREKANERARRYRKNKKQQGLAKANDVAAETVTVTANDVTRHVTISIAANESIQEEGLSMEDLKKDRSGNTRARGTRLKQGAPLTQEYIDAAVEHGAPVARIPVLWAEFIDYWSALPGSRGTKLDWLATWRNRIRQLFSKGVAHERNGSVYPNSSSQQSGSTAVLAGVAAAAERRARERSAAGQQRPISRDADPAERTDPELFGAG